tara:strand:+ start:2376 stop:3029 length:654 start_codon:yes stop_codon:yes gene_type:complete
MNKKERAKVILQRLEEIYPETHIPLYHINTFTLLIAVVLSAQSRDEKVNQLTKSLFEIGFTPERMLKLGYKNIYNYIKDLGLAKSKAKYVHSLSKILVEKFNSEVPKTFTELESLPGVGHKTASVVMAQAYGYPAFPVDTHIHRLAQRWLLSSGKNVKQTELDLKSLFPKKKWNKLHLQIIFYGREYCSARGCDGTVCMLCNELFPNRTTAVSYKKA